MTTQTHENQAHENQAPEPHQVIQTNDVVIGVLLGLDREFVPLVAFPDSPSPLGVPARATVTLTEEDIGREVALLFERGDLHKPLIIGRIHAPKSLQQHNPPLETTVDGDSLVFNAQKDIVLSCGMASITLTKAGKVLIRGTYLLSRSSGANRIKGGSVQIN